MPLTMTNRRLFFLPLLLVALGPSSQAQDTTTSTNMAEIRKSWQVPPPDDTKWDWVRLTSGEWLKGEIKSMQDDQLEFDSDEMDLQTFDWEDVSILISPHSSTVMFDDKTKAVGTLTITDDRVIVEGEEPIDVERGNVFAIVAGEPKEWNYWAGKVSVGLSLRGGNTDQADFNARITLKRRALKTRFILDYLGNIGKVEGVETVNNHRATANMDVFLTRRLFVRTPTAEYFRDPFQNVAHRAALGLGVGYDIFNRFNSKKHKWDVTVGPAYVHTWYDSVQPGEAPDESAAAAALSTRFNTDITKRTEFTFIYSGQVNSGTYNSLTHHFEAIFEIELTRLLDLDVSFIWDNVNDPAPRSDGTTPEKNDYRIILALGLDW